MTDSYDMVLRREDGEEIPAALASGGTLVGLAFLALVHVGTTTGLFVVEEPENGLHPQKLKDVIEVLRRLAETRVDRQVIVSTHSPLLLDFVEPDEVRVFLRNDRNDIEVHDLAMVPDIKDRLKYMMLGELVFNEGEQQFVKEIRDHARAGSGGGGE